MISFEVSNVDEVYKTLSMQYMEFINEPIDMLGWGVRVIFIDPEENLIELFTSLTLERCSRDLIEEDKKYHS